MPRRASNGTRARNRASGMVTREKGTVGSTAVQDPPYVMAALTAISSRWHFCLTFAHTARIMLQVCAHTTHRPCAQLSSAAREPQAHISKSPRCVPPRHITQGPTTKLYSPAPTNLTKSCTQVLGSLAAMECSETERRHGEESTHSQRGRSVCGQGQLW